ncbi:MAG: hypothetical protein AMXMBFR82_39720 [Candidatus Hydrogenedentota bacterium]
MIVKIAALLSVISAQASELPDIRAVEPDLSLPPMTEGNPQPGARVRQTAPEYEGTDVYHALYLPTDWRAGERYPVIVEYAGNGPYKNDYGDVCTGKVEDCSLGYGVSGGEGFIWLCLPYVSADGQRNQLQWWGDIDATVDYCRRMVPRICETYGGDPSKVILTGFSRGSIACNFIGLHDDAISALWCAFICHSHYDGVKAWPYEGSDRASAMARLQRLGDRPQFISHEGSVDATRDYLATAYPGGDFTFQSLLYRNHTDTWVLRDIPARDALRHWILDLLE